MTGGIMFKKLSVSACVFFLILLPFLIGGCWDQIGIKERAIVIGMGIDKIQGDEPIRLTVQIVNLPTLRTGESGGIGEIGNQSSGKNFQSRESVIIETSNGKSLNDAIHNFLKYTSRRMTFTHNRIVVLGTDLAQAGVDEVFETMGRDYQFRATNWIFVAEKTAQEILESNTELGTVPAKDIDQMMMNLTKSGFILPMNSNEFILHLKNEGKCSFAPFVQVENAEQNHKSRIMIEKTAIFKKNRLKGVLTADESQNLIWFADKQKSSSLIFPHRTGKSSAKVSLKISNGTTRITPQFTKDGIMMKIYCSGSAVLQGMGGIKNSPETMRQIKLAAERIMEKRLNDVIEKAKFLKADFLGYARIIHSQCPEEWRRIKRNWDEEFPHIKSSVRFKIGGIQFGLIKDSILDMGGNGA
jgi:spore germination protein KC